MLATGNTLTLAVFLAVSIMYLTIIGLSAVGLVLAIQATEVNPPKAAALVLV